MKRVRSLGLILITVGFLSTAGPAWAAGGVAHRSPVLPEISAGILNAWSELWDSVLTSVQALLAEGDPAALENEKGGKDPKLEPTPEEAPLPPPPPPGGGCIDPNGCT